MGYGNLAYKEEYYIPKKRPPKKKKLSVKKQRVNRMRYIRYIVAIAVAALAAGFMISTFVTVHETKSRVRELEAQLAEAEAVTSQKAFDLDHKIDLATIEDEATNRLGMKRPEKYQTVYVNVSRDDVTEKTAGEVENARNKFSEVFKNIVSNIVEFFSIK